MWNVCVEKKQNKSPRMTAILFWEWSVFIANAASELSKTSNAPLSIVGTGWTLQHHNGRNGRCEMLVFANVH